LLTILCRPTGVLPAVPPIPKAPGTLLPDLGLTATTQSDASEPDKTACSQLINPATDERLEIFSIFCAL